MVTKVKIFFQSHPLLIILVLALTFRFATSQFGFHDDIYSNTAWGEWINKNGPKGFYEARGWIYSSPTQPPLISLLYGFNLWLYGWLMYFFASIGVIIATYHLAPTKMLWFFDFAQWFGNSMYGETPFKFGALISMKLVAILADLALGVVIYLLARGRSSKPWIWSVAYLFFPFSWYVSALWGQYDQLSTLFLLLSFLLLYKRVFTLSVLLMFCAVQVKPTVLFLAPFYVFYFYHQKPQLKNYITSLIGISGLFILFTGPFVKDKSILPYTFQNILPLIFNNDRYGLVNHAFNFWQMLAPSGGWSTTFYLLGIPALIWGIVIWFMTTLIAALITTHDKSLKSLMLSLFLISTGAYLFMTGMVDRYLYSGAVFLIVLTAYDQRLRRYCWLMLILFSVNLFYSWGFPFLDKYTAWENPLLIRFFSFLQLAVFIAILKKIQFVKIVIDSLFALHYSHKDKVIRLVEEKLRR